MDFPTINPASLPQNSQEAMKQQLMEAMLKKNTPQGDPRNSTGTSNALDAVGALANAYAMQQYRAKQAAQRQPATGAVAAPVQGWGNVNAQSLQPMGQPAVQPMPMVGPQSSYMP